MGERLGEVLRNIAELSRQPVSCCSTPTSRRLNNQTLKRPLPAKMRQSSLLKFFSSPGKNDKRSASFTADVTSMRMLTEPKSVRYV
jgi:hypothetical protein